MYDSTQSNFEILFYRIKESPPLGAEGYAKNNNF